LAFMNLVDMISFFAHTLALLIHGHNWGHHPKP
jgi:hypothetical protein